MGTDETGSSNDGEEYGLHRKVPIAGMYNRDDEPIVELGAIETVPEGQVILDDKPTSEEAYQRKARVGLSIEEARKVADALNEMADRMERAGGSSEGN